MPMTRGRTHAQSVPRVTSASVLAWHPSCVLVVRTVKQGGQSAEHAMMENMLMLQVGFSGIFQEFFRNYHLSYFRLVAKDCQGETPINLR